MKCDNCKFYHKEQMEIGDIGFCKIQNRINPNGCKLFNDNIEDKNICYNCEYWMGGGDFGTTCQKQYYKASTNGFNIICKLFKRKT